MGHGGLITLDEARAALAREAGALPARTVPLEEALGLVLAAPATAAVNLPPAHVSAMDGYAVREADLPAGELLPVAFEVPAGTLPPELPPGACARIFTGAALPEGADTVVEQERSQVSADGRVRLDALPRGSNVRPKGEIVAEGRPVGQPGEVVTPQRMGLLAAAGVDAVEVIPRPRVAILGTGSELTRSGEATGPVHIRDSNGPMLAAFVRQAGFGTPWRSTVADRLEELESRLTEALERAEVVLTTGGVSVGDYDLVPQAVARLGGRELFHRVAQKPGKPILAARVGRGWLLGLPGNPLAVLVGWRLYVLPLLRTLSGEDSAFQERPLTATLEEPVRNTGKRTVLRPARLHRTDAGASVRVIPWRGSHDLAAGGRANALARLDPRVDLPAGAAVPAYPL